MRRLLHMLAATAALALIAGAISTAGSAPARADPTSAASTAGGYGSTPLMGWNTYYGLGGDFTQNDVLSIADFLNSSGLARAGYKTVWLDGGWQAADPRGADGQLQPDPARFPDGMKALVAAIHAKGLQAGIYTDAGPYDPTHCGLGSYGHYQQDANTFAAWGFDVVKADFLCGIAANLDPKTVYTQFADALAHNSSGRRILLNICNPVTSPDWGNYPESQQSTNTWTYAPGIAESWRTYTDVGFEGQVNYSDVLRNFDANAQHPESVGPGHYGDPDNLAPQLGMSDEEFRTQLALWAISAAPLVIGSDPRSLSATTLGELTDPDVVAIDQDSLGKEGTRVGAAGTTEVWRKPLADGSVAVALLNRGDSAATISSTAAAVGLGAGAVRVTDAWTHGVTTSSGTIRASVPAHGTALLRVSRRGLTPLSPRVVVDPPTIASVNGSTPATDPSVVAAGSTLRLRTTVHDDGLVPVVVDGATFSAPTGWTVAADRRHPTVVLPHGSAVITGTATIPSAAPVGPAGISAAVTTVPRGRPTVTSAPLALTVAPAPPTGTSDLAAHPWVSATSGWMQPAVDASVGGGPISINGTVYPTGIGVASPSDVRYSLGAACTTLTGTVGIDDAVKAVDTAGGTAGFTVVGDGKVLFSSGTVTRDQTVPFSVDLRGVSDLHLQVDDGGDGGYNDRADWAGLTVSCR